MPILPPEPYLFPEDLFADAAPPSPGPGRWWALHTRPRTEKELARRCLARGIPFFLPLCRRRVRVRARLLTSQAPLFPGYFFLLADEPARVNVLTTNLVIRCLDVVDQGQLAAELTHVHRLMISELPLAPEQRLPPGTPIRIVSGPLAGMTGKVLRETKKLKFIVEVTFLRQGVSVEIDAAMLEKAG
jgi:transcriptional antiterminator RfaH